MFCAERRLRRENQYVFGKGRADMRKRPTIILVLLVVLLIAATQLYIGSK